MFAVGLILGILIGLLSAFGILWYYVKKLE